VHRETGVVPNPARVKAEHDVFARDARRDKLLRDRLRCAVVLNPNFAIDNVNVHDRPMHAARLVPAYVHHFIVVLFAVHNRLSLDLSVRGLLSRITSNGGSSAS
jgi:hypothetical protein